MPVVDASVVVDWVKPGADPDLPSGRLLSKWLTAGTPLLAPRMLIWEVSNALLTGIRRGDWEGGEADLARVWLRELPIEIVEEPRDETRAWELARWHDNHPFYDLIYVALAERMDTHFVTEDRKLIRRLADLEFVVAPEDIA